MSCKGNCFVDVYLILTSVFTTLILIYIVHSREDYFKPGKFDPSEIHGGEARASVTLSTKNQLRYVAQDKNMII